MEVLAGYDAVRLFVERAAAADPGFALAAANVAVVAELQPAAGLPLAIEPAALGPGAAPGRDPGPARRPVPAAGLRWADGRRPPADAAGHGRLELGAARGPDRAAAAAAVGVLGRLDGGGRRGGVRRRRPGPGRGPGGPVRAGRPLAGGGGGWGPGPVPLLETLRAYGAERLAEAGEADGGRPAPAGSWSWLPPGRRPPRRPPLAAAARRRLRQPAGHPRPGDGRARPGDRAAAGRGARLVLGERPVRRGSPWPGRGPRPGRGPATHPGGGQGAPGHGHDRGAAHPDRGHRRRRHAQPGAVRAVRDEQGAAVQSGAGQRRAPAARPQRRRRAAGRGGRGRSRRRRRWGETFAEFYRANIES